MLAVKITVFFLALLLGIEASSFVRYYSTTLEEEITAARKPVDHTGHWGISKGPYRGVGPGPGSSAGSDGTGRKEEVLPRNGTLTVPLRIISKKKAEYTEAARTNGTQGTVTLRVTFLASGGIGSITTIKGLPYGLTEKAIDAARQIKFEPEHVDGAPRTTSRPVTFTFNIY